MIQRLISWCCLVAAMGVLLNLQVRGAEPHGVRKLPGQQIHSPREALLLYRDAASFQNNSVFELAVDEWQRFLERYPEDPLAPNVQHYLGVCFLQLKQYQRAADAFQEVIANHPELEAIQDSYLSLGWCQYTLAGTGAEGMYAKAAETFAALVKMYPKGKHADQATFFLAEAEYHQGNRKAAVAHYAKVVEAFPTSALRADALYALGVTYEELEQYADAGSIYDLYLKEFGENPLAVEVRFRKAETVRQAGEYAVAAAAFAAVAKDHPNHELAPRAWHNLGLTLLQLKQYQRAVVGFQEVVANHPEFEAIQDAYLNLGIAWFQQHAYIPAIDALTRAIELAPDAGSFLWRGIARYATADYGPALDDFTRALDFPLELEADRLVAYWNRGRIWHEREEFDRADADFTAALRLKPSDAARFAELHFRRGISRYAAGWIEDAARDFQEAIRMASPFPDAHRRLAACWVQLGFLDHAERQYATAWEQEQGSANASPAPVLWLGRGDTPIALERLGNYRLARTAAPSAR